jgi:virginiamycin B lyase
MLNKIFISLFFFLYFPFNYLNSIEVTVKDENNNPLDLVMVTIKAEKPMVPPRNDNGYPPENLAFTITPEITIFTNSNGKAIIDFPYSDTVIIRLRKNSFIDKNIRSISNNSKSEFLMQKATDLIYLASQYPSNSWVAALDFGEYKEYKKDYLEQCGFCHQQGSFFMRRNHSESNWEDIINRMIGYGSRPSGKVQKKLPSILNQAYLDLLKHPEKVPPGLPWGKELHNIVIREWIIGDSFSQMHDLLFHKNGNVYVGDNLQDRIWEINPETGKTIVYKVPKEDYDELGGLLSGRLRTFQKHETYVGVHSLAESPIDGNIFITPSLQKRLIEFNPLTKEFSNIPFENGLYPHTIRVDQKDRVWFTLALSNQIGMFDRNKKEYKMYDLPARSNKESISLWISGFILKLMNWGFPMHFLPVDERVSGMPLPYGIDISPNGMIWFARLHADSIGMINPETNEIKNIKTPFRGPRRLRIDKENNVWIAAFPEGMIVRYDPNNEQFTNFPIPTAIDSVETPYSLNVDKDRHTVWVTGTSSDNIMEMDISSGIWKVYPMSRKVTFTRDVEFSPTGSAYTCNGAFPGWHIEDGQPTLIEIKKLK